MAAQHDNKTEINDGVLYFITDGGSARKLYLVESHSTSDDGSVSVVKGPAGIIGTHRESGAFSISLKARKSKNGRNEVAWDLLRDNDVRFRFEIQELGGQRYQYFRCRVSNVNDSADSGSRSIDITIVAPERTIIDPE